MRNSLLSARWFRAGISLIFLMCSALPAVTAHAATGVPRILNNQGRLLDASGTLLGGAGTEYCFKFSFYDAATVGSGSKVWPSGSPSTMTVTVRNGVYNVGIGDTNAGGDVLDFDFQSNDAIYLNVEVASKVGATCAPGDGAESFETLAPRQRIYAAGYAINASTVGGFLAAQYASGNQIPVLSAGNLILGGTNPILSASTTNTLTLQGSSTGDLQFFSSANKITTSGNATFAGTVSASAASTTNASTTNLTVANSASTSNLVVSNGFTFQNATGILKAVAGVVSAALVDLANDVTGVLGVGNGGTGQSAIAANALVLGNGTGPVATTSPGLNGQVLSLVNGVPTWVATTTLATISGTLSVDKGGTGISATPSFGQLLVGNGTNYTLTGTSSLGLPTFNDLGSYMTLASWYATTSDAIDEGSANLFYSNARVQTYLDGINKEFFFSTSSAQYFASVTDLFSTSSARYFLSQNREFAFATTSATYFLAQNRENAFATTSANYWESQQTSRTADDLTDNSIEDLSDVASITENYGDILSWNGTTWTDFATSSLGISLADTTGILGATRGGTGLSSIVANQILIGAAGNTVTQVATSSLGLPTFSDLSSYLTLASWYATTTDGLDEGLTNLYYQDSRVQTYLNSIAKEYFFSTTSAQYFLAQNREFAFASTSANYFVASSSTIPKTYTNNTFTGNNTFSNATTTTLGITGITSALLSTNADGTVVATTSISSNLLNTSGNWIGTFDGQEGGFYLANSFATTSADYWRTQRDFFSTTSIAYYNSVTDLFSTSSARYFLSQNREFAFATTSATYFLAQNREAAFATTSANYWESQQTARNADNLADNSIEDLNDVAAMTKNYGDLLSWNGTTWTDFATSSLGISLSDTTGILGATRGGTGLSSIVANQILIGAAGNTVAQVATSSLGLPTFADLSSYLTLAAWYATTTDGLDEGLTNLYYQDSRVQTYLNTIAKEYFFSTTSAQYFLSQNREYAFASTSANYFISSSTTIPKTYSNNIFTGSQTFNGQTTLTNASSTNITVSNLASTSNLVVSNGFTFRNVSGILKATAGVVAAAAVDLVNDVTGILGIANGGTGTSTAPSYGQLLVGNAAGGYDLMSTSSLGITSGSGSVGAGTTGQFPFYAADGTSLTATSLLFTSNNKIGIGTTSPTALLSVNPDTGYTGPVFVVGSSTRTLFSVGSDGVTTIGDSSNTGDAVFQYGSDDNGWSVGYNSSDKTFRIASSTLLTSDVAMSIAKGGIATFFGGVRLPTLLGCSQALETDGSGNIVCGTDLSGGGGAWATSTDGLRVYPADATDVLVLGDTATTTTGNILEVAGGALFRNALTAYNTVTAPIFTATSTTATSTLPHLAVTAFGIGGDYITDFVGTGMSLSGGVLATSLGTLVDLATEVEGILGIVNGGTGTSTAPAYGQLLVGNAAGGYDLVATSSLGILSGGTWGSITGTLSNQTDLQSALDARLTLNAWYGTTTDGLDEGVNNLYFTANRVAGVIAGTTTNALAEGGTNLYYTDARVNTYLNSSTTVSKLYTANAFTALQSFQNASSTLFSAGYASTTNLFAGNLTLGSVNGPLHANNGVVSATSSILAMYGGTGQSTYATGDILYASNATTLSRLAASTDGLVLKLAGGVPTWAPDVSAGGGAGAWATTSNSLAVYTADTSDTVIIGASATSTTGSILEVFGQTYFSNVVGIGTTTPGSILSIGGVGNFRASGSTLYSSLALGQLVATSTLQVAGQTTLASASSTAVSSLEYFAVGRTATTTIQGGSTGTSTLQGFLNVLGTGSTSTFSGGLAANRLNLTGVNATSTAAGGFNITGGCYAINGTCIGAGGGVSSVSNSDSTLSVSPTTGAVVVSLNLANANVWTGLQRFNGASSTAVSALDYVAIGRTASTTIRGETNATSTFAGGVDATRVRSTATSTLAGLQLSTVTNCTRALETDASGNVVCGSDMGIDGVTVTTFTGNGTWTKSNYTGLSFTQVITTGSGGGGGGADSPDTTNEIVAGGGGAGGTAIEMIPAGSLGVTESVTVGTAGTAGTNTGGAGGAGNASSFGSHNSANGGGAGSGNVTNATGCAAAGAIAAAGTGGTAANGDINLVGGDGTRGTCDATTLLGGAGGASYWGGGGAGGAVSTTNGSVAGTNGDAYGAGGGGAISKDSTTGAAGGAGGGGIVVTMNYTSSGGDLAEWYETKDGVEAGDVVAISSDTYEYDSKLGLQTSSILEKATARSSSSVVGVVSSAPYETIGRDALASSKHPRPIALAGRVPVKVSLENGEIKAGDLLTVSSDPGRAMRSTKAGVTIGRALEDAKCDQNQEESSATTTEVVEITEDCTVLILVNTSYSTGALLNVAFRDLGLPSETIAPGLDYGRMILAEMLQQKKNITASTTLSEMLTDRLAAGLEIISPRVVADTLVVNAIEPVEKDIRVKLREDGKFVFERVSGDAMSLTFNATSTASSTIAVEIDALGNAMFAGALKATNIEIGSSENPGGLTMYDAETGEAYCTKIVHGQLETFVGTCAEIADIFAPQKAGPTASASKPPAQKPSPTPEPEVESEAPVSEEEYGGSNTSPDPAAEAPPVTEPESSPPPASTEPESAPAEETAAPQATETAPSPAAEDSPAAAPVSQEAPAAVPSESSAPTTE